MNRLQNNIVRFLKYVIELENLIIVLNIGSLSLHSRQVLSIDFCYAGEGVEAVSLMLASALVYAGIHKIILLYE